MGLKARLKNCLVSDPSQIVEKVKDFLPFTQPTIVNVTDSEVVISCNYDDYQMSITFKVVKQGMGVYKYHIIDIVAN